MCGYISLKQIQAIANTMDSYADQCSPLFHAGWLTYINKTHAADRPRQAPSARQKNWLLIWYIYSVCISIIFHYIVNIRYLQ
jgi:hypothetical protein